MNSENKIWTLHKKFVFLSKTNDRKSNLLSVLKNFSIFKSFFFWQSWNFLNYTVWFFMMQLLTLANVKINRIDKLNVWALFSNISNWSIIRFEHFDRKNTREFNNKLIFKLRGLGVWLKFVKFEVNLRSYGCLGCFH